jgi:DNA modification methylase
MNLTNEEKAVAAYAGAALPTDPSTVNAKTRLESLNLNWKESDLPERERTKHVHRLHPYLGKYIPQLVEIFLRKYFQEGQTVLDPFCGSGTTLVQANELGINSVGFDVSAFNIILCQTKTTNYDLPAARKEVLDILQRVEQQTQSQMATPTLWDNTPLELTNTFETTQYLQEWFAPKALGELLAYRALIDKYHYQDLLKVILSRAARSSRLTTHFDLDFPKKPQIEPYHCYKHSRLCAPTNTAFQFIRRYSLDTIKRLEDFARRRTDASVEVHHADSRTGDIPPIDGVITSPPYVGLIDYHEQHAYAYNLLELEDKRVEEIGAAAKGSSQKARRQYQEDMATVFQNIMPSIRPGGRLIVVAGDRANLYPEIAQMVGVDVEATVTRHVNRRTGRRSGEFYESVFVWRKATIGAKSKVA